MHGRRDCLRLIGGAFSLPLLASTGSVSAIAGQPSMPDPKQFQSGDFLWPKKPGAFVPYDAGPPRPADADKAKWYEERDRFIANVATTAPYFTPAQIERMHKLTYEEFRERYTGTRKPGSGTYSVSGPVYVGHVAIVDVDEPGAPWIIEALWGRGVIRRPYTDWTTERAGEVVWLGRLAKLPATDRARISSEAGKHVGKPYDFWNFNLNDDTGFYCSKLAWMSAFRSLNLAVDDDLNPKRAFWFSPKQFLYVARMTRLIDPGPYGTR
jgi:hypothetical protein